MYNLVKRQVESEILPMAQGLNIGVFTYSPLGGGLLSGKYGADPSEQSDPLVPVSETATGKVRRLPPVDPNSTAPAETHVSRTSQGPIPFYPTTGI